MFNDRYFLSRQIVKNFYKARFPEIARLIQAIDIVTFSANGTKFAFYGMQIPYFKQGHFMKRVITPGAALMAFSACLLAGAANANTISLAGYNGPSNQITCVPSCSGFIGPNPGLIQLSGTDADAYASAGNPTGELARLNELLVQFNPARDTVNYVNKTDVEQNTYTTDLQYFSIKKSTSLWYFENTSGGTVTVTALGDAWSHTTEYGPPAVVPLPATAWLFGSALLGLVSVSRRKRA